MEAIEENATDPAPAAPPPAIADNILLALVNGFAESQCTAIAIKAGMSAAAAKQLIADARLQIRKAADFQRDEQTALAIRRCEGIYSRATAAKDPRTALAAQKELSKLMRLYDVSDDDKPGDAGAAEQLARVASHLLPLKMAGDEYPIEEHARLAADFIRRNRGA